MTYMPKQKDIKNKREIGSHYERLAVDYLCQKGYKIICQNYRCKCGEIDIIAIKDAYIIFIEVKYRRTTTYGYPREAVTYQKKQHIYRTAMYYLLSHYGCERSCRFDVIEILQDQLTHIEAAF